MKKIIILIISLEIAKFSDAQNVGIGTINPLDKLHVDSGNIRIGKDEWGIPTNSRFLKIGDGDYITLGEEEADDKLTIKAKEVFIRPSGLFTTVPVSIQGSDNFSHFFFGANENTYIRAGKNNGNVILNDITGGKVGVGVFPTRAALEQNGSVVNTAALFGGNGKGVSLQKDWPAIGLNHYFDGQHKSIGGGYGAQIGVDQNTGSIYFTQFSNNAPVPNGLLLNPNAAIYFKAGKIGVNTNNPQAPIDIYTPFNPYENNYALAPFAGLRLSGTNFSIYWNIWAFNSLVFTANGGIMGLISSTDGGYYSYSDQRMKRNITAMEDGVLPKLLNLHPSTYFMKDEPANNRQKHIGFMAHELQTAFPEVVTEDGNGMKMVNYAGLVPVLTKAIQEQQKMIEELKKEVMQLKAGRVQ